MPVLDLIALSAIFGLGLAGGLSWTMRRGRRSLETDPGGAEERLLTNLAHELRTPLTGLIGFADLAAQPALDPARRADGLRRATSAGRRLLQLVNNLRDHARLRRGQLRCHPIDAAPLAVIARIEQLTRHAAERKGLLFAIHLDDEVPPTAHFDPDRTAQVLMALLDNAIRFTRRGHVALTCDVSELPDGRPALRFAVQDTGDGMPERLCRQLTSSRAVEEPVGSSGTVSGTFRSTRHGPRQDDDGTDRRHGGVGLGLSLAIGIVEQLGGTMHARSTPGRGSTLQATLPIEPARGAYAVADLVSTRLGAPRPATRPPAPHTSSPAFATTPAPAALHAHALVAIADQDQRLLVGHALECLGLAVDEISSEDWQQQVGSHDLVVLDGLERNGETRREARDFLGAGPQRPPVLGLVPRSATDAVHADLQAAGFDAVLPIPLDRDALHVVLGDLLRPTAEHRLQRAGVDA